MLERVNCWHLNTQDETQLCGEKVSKIFQNAVILTESW